MSGLAVVVGLGETPGAQSKTGEIDKNNLQRENWDTVGFRQMHLQYSVEKHTEPVMNCGLQVA